MNLDFLDPTEWRTFGLPPLVLEISALALSALIQNCPVATSLFQDRAKIEHRSLQTTSLAVHIHLALHRSTGRNVSRVLSGLHSHPHRAPVEPRCSQHSALRLGLTFCHD